MLRRTIVTTTQLYSYGKLKLLRIVHENFLPNNKNFLSNNNNKIRLCTSGACNKIAAAARHLRYHGAMDQMAEKLLDGDRPWPSSFYFHFGREKELYGISVFDGTIWKLLNSFEIL